MNQECSIVRDLLPLYAERLTSPETAAFVEKHLRTCADCRAALQETQAPPALQPAPDAAPLQHLQKRLARKRLQIIVMTALFVLTAVISAAFPSGNCVTASAMFPKRASSSRAPLKPT